jgi:hypothetical protein
MASARAAGGGSPTLVDAVRQTDAFSLANAEPGVPAIHYHEPGMANKGGARPVIDLFSTVVCFPLQFGRSHRLTF